MLIFLWSLHSMKSNFLKLIGPLFIVSIISCKTAVGENGEKSLHATTGATKTTKSKEIPQDQIQQQVRDLLSKKRYLSLVSIDAAKKPVVRAVVYANDHDSLYILSENDNKVHQITANEDIAFSVDDYHEDWSKLVAIQMQGKGTVVKDEVEKKKAFEMLQKKFKQYAAIPMRVSDVQIIKIIPQKGVFLDNPAGFGTKHEVLYN